MGIFKACDIRGVYGEDLTAGLAKEIGLAVGSRLGGRPVIVGGDVRVSTPELKDGLIAGLLETGCRVIDLGCVPTPVFYFAERLLQVYQGVMVTASHNPAGYNGFKITLSQWPIMEEDMSRIEAAVSAHDFRRAPGGNLVKRDVLDEYRRFLRRMAEGFGAPGGADRTVAAGDLLVVVDCGNGCYSRIAPDVFREHGYRVEELYCEEDGRFLHRPPNPAVAENLRDLSDKVVSTGANLGVAFDGDGDRVVFVDPRGQVVENDKMIAIIARHLLRRSPGGKVVYDLKCSNLVPDEVTKAGGMPIMEKSGYAFIKTSLLRERALLGAEISGHYFFTELGGDDGLFAALVVADLIHQSGGDLGTIVADLPRYYITPDLRLPYPGTDKRELLETLAAALRAESGCKLSLLDGVRGEFAEGWGLIRESITEPMFTLRFEAREPGKLSSIKDRFLAPVPAIKTLVDEVWWRYAG